MSKDHQVLNQRFLGTTVSSRSAIVVALLKDKLRHPASFPYHCLDDGLGMKLGF